MILRISLEKYTKPLSNSRYLDCCLGLRVKEALCRRVPAADGRAFRVRSLHRQSFQIRGPRGRLTRQVGSFQVINYVDSVRFGGGETLTKKR